MTHTPTSPSLSVYLLTPGVQLSCSCCALALQSASSKRSPLRRLLDMTDPNELCVLNVFFRKSLGLGGTTLHEKAPNRAGSRNGFFWTNGRRERWWKCTRHMERLRRQTLCRISHQLYRRQGLRRWSTCQPLLPHVSMTIWNNEFLFMWYDRVCCLGMEMEEEQTKAP